MLASSGTRCLMPSRSGTFRNPANGRVVTASVVDRGPYVGGRQWDMTAGLCAALGHCYTGTIYWMLP